MPTLGSLHPALKEAGTQGTLPQYEYQKNRLPFKMSQVGIGATWV